VIARSRLWFESAGIEGETDVVNIRMQLQVIEFQCNVQISNRIDCRDNTPGSQITSGVTADDSFASFLELLDDPAVTIEAETTVKLVDIKVPEINLVKELFKPRGPDEFPQRHKKGFGSIVCSPLQWNSVGNLEGVVHPEFPGIGHEALHQPGTGEVQKWQVEANVLSVLAVIRRKCHQTALISQVLFSLNQRNWHTGSIERGYVNYLHTHWRPRDV
jgi:hypothetical protein